jgi:hypothetical protein
LIGAPRHRIFVAFDDLAHGRQAIDAIRSQGLAVDDDIWEFSGDEGARILDPSGAGHGLHGRVIRFFQWLMADDYEYLQRLGTAIGGGGLVVAVRADGDERVHRINTVFRAHGGYDIRYCRHWDYNEL